MQQTCDQTAILPLVVRPAPDAPASVLQGVASVADHTNINSHYRFFQYSRADLPVSTGPDWGGGSTEPTVCSSFDRLAAVRAGLPLHPSLSIPGVPDGMKLYCVDTRVGAGNTLFAMLKYYVLVQCNEETKHQLAGYCLNLAGNIARQITNCFADDGCDDPDGSHWLNPGAGIAVSPDDMLDWDTWRNGGTYGYNEPLVYQPTGYRRAYAWAAPKGAGSITVKVVTTDNPPMPFENATVLVNSNAIGTTDQTGTCQIPVIAAGNYDVGAQFDPCAQPGHPNNCKLPLEQASTMSVLPPNGSIIVNLTLCAGPVVNGVVTSCPQPGSGPSLSVSMTETQTGPDVCFTGSGYTPSAPVQITYSNVPGRSGGGNFSTSSDSAGNIKAIDTNWEGAVSQFCNQSQVDGQVTVIAHDVVSDVAIQGTLPSAYWCPVTLVGTNFNGGCH
jgi:hypothetical protein